MKVVDEYGEDDGDHDGGEEDEDADAVEGEGWIVGWFDGGSRPHCVWIIGLECRKVTVVGRNWKKRRIGIVEQKIAVKSSFLCRVRRRRLFSVNRALLRSAAHLTRWAMRHARYFYRS